MFSKSSGKTFTGMSHKLPVVSGADLIKYLAKQGLEIKRQTSSHGVVQKEWRVFSVPLPHEPKKGTLIGILTQAGIEVEDFKRELRGDTLKWPFFSHPLQHPVPPGLLPHKSVH